MILSIVSIVLMNFMLLEEILLQDSERHIAGTSCIGQIISASTVPTMLTMAPT